MINAGIMAFDDGQFDVAIVGGGPGGCAAALSLRQHDPSLSVVLFESFRYDSPRVGESLTPLAKPLLQHLAVWEAFQAQSPREVYGTAATWGRGSMVENDFLLVAGGAGWHVDRAAFDAMLFRAAERRGVTVVSGARIKEFARADRVWRGEWSGLTGRAHDSRASTAPAAPATRRPRPARGSVSARFLVDATGRSALVARRQGGRCVALDRLVGIGRFFEDAQADPRTRIETCPVGWWYTSGLPNSRRIMVLMTDADLASEQRLFAEDAWSAHLRLTTDMATAVRRAQPLGRMFVRAVESRRLDPVAGEDWLAVGDAASTFDPLSSQGILKALRGGIFASYAIADQLTKHSPAGLDRYRQFIRHEFESYAKIRGQFYAQERRWPEEKFWKRRAAPHASEGDGGRAVLDGMNGRIAL